ncbi:hypothetical protein TNCV_3094201 [Trichonephila clavipes]|nr:hypothetical protein TNCV_3094201 [Trichonephila clavipes]
MVRPDYQPFKRRRESGSFKKRNPICRGVFPLRPWVARKSSIGHGHLFDCQFQTFYRADVPPTGRIQIWSVCPPEKDVESSQTVKSSTCEMQPDILLLEYRVRCALQ